MLDNLEEDLMAIGNWALPDFAALLNVSPAARPQGQTTSTPIDLGPIGHGGPAEAIFGCNCTKNPSGMSPAEVAAAQAEFARSQGASGSGGTVPSFLRG